VKFLLSLDGIDVNKPDSDGVTALMAATHARHVTTMKVLLETPTIKPNLQDRRGMTAFHFAIRSLSDAIVGELFRCPNVNKEIRDNAKVRFEFRKLHLIMQENMN
jgi:ankyrin repeat protein